MYIPNGENELYITKSGAFLDFEELDDLSKKQKKMTQGKSTTPVLDNFGRDITKLASDCQIDPIIGRSDEIERVTQILSRRKKNNPILIGEPGCVLGNTMIKVKKISDLGVHNFLSK